VSLCKSELTLFSRFSDRFAPPQLTRPGTLDTRSALLLIRLSWALVHESPRRTCCPLNPAPCFHINNRES
jgi:hypothetical protein